MNRNRLCKWLAAPIIVLLAAAVGRAADPNAMATAALANYLTDPSELDEVQLSVVDQKLALSLAIETHVQIELLEHALSAIRDADLERLTRQKLQLYRALFSTLNELTNGQAASVIADAVQKIESQIGADGSPASVEEGAREMSASTTQQGAASRIRKTAHGESRQRRPRGFRAVVKNVADAAFVRVRLEVAGQYAGMLRSHFKTAGSEEFDRRYLTVEAFNQMQLVALLRVFEQHASADFAAIIHVATDAAERHLRELRRLVGRLPRDTAAVRIDTRVMIAAVGAEYGSSTMHAGFVSEALCPQGRVRRYKEFISANDWREMEVGLR